MVHINVLGRPIEVNDKDVEEEDGQSSPSYKRKSDKRSLHLSVNLVKYLRQIDWKVWAFESRKSAKQVFYLKLLHLKKLLKYVNGHPS